MDGFRMYYITLSHTISKREKKMHSLLDAESKQKKYVEKYTCGYSITYRKDNKKE